MNSFDRFARFYDGDYRDYTDDLETILDLAQECGGPILELGCGTGRVMAPLLAAGYAVTGVDISPALLAVAKPKLAQSAQPKLSKLVEADLRSFDLPAKNFALAICTSNTLMHLTTPADQLAVLHNAYRHLRPGGLIFIDLFNPDVARLIAVHGLQELADQWEEPTTDAHVLKWSVRTVDWATQRQETLFLYEELFGDGAMHRTPCPFTLRFLWRNEAELMLQTAGFTVDAVWGDFDGAPYEAASEHLILLASKS